MKQSEKLLIGNKYRNFINLDNIIWIPNNPNIDARLEGHADLSVFSDKKGTVFTAKHLDLPGAVKIDENQSDKYPNDVQLNISLVGNNAILNEKYVSRKILAHLKAGKWNIINVKQGYCSCSCLVVDDNSIITSDTGIYEEAKKNKIDSLLINAGHIVLDGFQYGFIGGSGFNSNNIMYFTGNLDHHPDREQIINFITIRNIEIKYLTNRPIFDIGGAIKIS